MEYKSTVEWVDAMKEHKCDNKEFIPCDDPVNRKVGSVCVGCGEQFFVGILAMRNSRGETPQWIKEALKTVQGKQTLLCYCVTGELNPDKGVMLLGEAEGLLNDLLNKHNKAETFEDLIPFVIEASKSGFTVIPCSDVSLGIAKYGAVVFGQFPNEKGELMEVCANPEITKVTKMSKEGVFTVSI